jgi:purine-binding chemotaxis protein CheW
MKAGKPKRTRERTAIVWGEVHERLDAARRAIERASVPTADETRRILRARAAALARAPAPAETAEAPLEVVEFVLAYERYALATRWVREVYPLESLTPLPCTPAFVRGIVNIRGEMLSVVDLKRFFDLPEKGLTDLNKVIVLESPDMRFGVLADAIVGVRRIATGTIQPSLPTLTGIRQEYLAGVTPERTTILDAERLLTDERMVVREQVTG